MRKETSTGSASTNWEITVQCGGEIVLGAMVFDDGGVESVNLGPEEWIAQVLARNVPERVARLHGVALGRAADLLRRSQRREQHRADDDGARPPGPVCHPDLPLPR